jgi:serine O-acetyltransferase
MDAVKLHRISRSLHLRGFSKMGKAVEKINWLFHKSRIGKEVPIGAGLILMGGVIMNHKISLGKNVFIGHGVTIGGRGYDQESLPVIGNNVHIAPGAMILGNIAIGNFVAIGANAVVIKSVPANCFVAGCPGKIIRENVSDEYFLSKDFDKYYQFF